MDGSNCGIENEAASAAPSPPVLVADSEMFAKGMMRVVAGVGDA